MNWKVGTFSKAKLIWKIKPKIFQAQHREIFTDNFEKYLNNEQQTTNNLEGVKR